MSGTVCSYKGCSKSYSTDKEVSFFKFPDDPKRRKKWMDHCDNPELFSLSDRQLRLKRVCADHFSSFSFISAETRNQLTEKAIPLSQKEHEAETASAKAKALEESSHQGQRKRGRPPKFSLVLVKKDPEEEATQKLQEEEIDLEAESAEDEPSSQNGDVEYAPPPMLRKQIKQESENASSPKGKVGRPPKLVAADDDKDAKTKVGRRKSISGRRMADLSVIDEVVNELKLTADHLEDKSRKRNTIIGPDERILSKRLKSAGFEDPADNSDEEFDDDDDSDEEEVPEKSNREFEKFLEGLRKAIKLPSKWGMGGVIWDPLNKMKVIAVSEADVQMNGHVRLKRAVQVFEDSTVKVSIDGIDMTINFGVQSVNTEEEVGQLIDKVSHCRVCSGVQDFQPDDIIYLPYAKKRGCSYYSEACPVVINEGVVGTVCNPCMSLQKAVVNRKEKEQQQIDNRKARALPQDINNEFGKSLYGLLNEILDDADALKSDRKQDRDAVLNKYSNELNVMNGEIQKTEKMPHVNVSVDEVSASFQDIVSRLGFASPANADASKGDGKPRPFPMKPVIRDDRRTRETSILPIKSSGPKINTSALKMVNHINRQSNVSSSSVSTSNSTNFSMSDGQTYELIGEVGGNDMMQVVEMGKGPKNEAIEIIEVDDETMAKLTAQNAGMFFQNSSPGTIQVATLDPSDPNISQILKSINSSS